MRDEPLYSAFERQKHVKAEITVVGVADWRMCFERTISLDKIWSSICGGNIVSHLRYLEKEAEVNHHSLERSAVNAFINSGYILEELEVEFTNREEREWGRCIWYKDHPEYKPEIKSVFFPDPTWIPRNFWHAMFKTEHAGDQKFNLFSTQMLGAALMGLKSGILLHKSMVYHKVVFSKPKEANAA